MSCDVCAGRTEMFICRTCLRDVENALGDLPGLIEDLVAREIRQSRTYRRARVLLVDEELAELEEEYGWRRARIPAHLRTRDDRVTLPAHGTLPDASAGALLDEARNILTTTARSLAEGRGAEIMLGRWEPLLGPACVGHAHSFRPADDERAAGCGLNVDPTTGATRCVLLHCSHASCEAIRHGEHTGTAAALVRWFLHHAAAIALDESAAEIHSQILGLRDRITRAVDAGPSVIYAGPCRAEYTDPDAGDWCCARDLYDWAGNDELTCDGTASGDFGCGAKHDRLDREQWLVDQIEDALVPLDALQAVVEKLLELRWPPTTTIQSWRARGRLDARGLDRTGRELFRGGDVVDLLRDWSARMRARAS